MKAEKLASLATYDPNKLLDLLIEKLALKNDAALARALDIAAPVISKLRNKRLAVGASLLINMHEATGISILDLRCMMGDTRASFGGSSGSGE